VRQYSASSDHHPHSRDSVPILQPNHAPIVTSIERQDTEISRHGTKLLVIPACPESIAQSVANGPGVGSLEN
jgi:hypothetical protein